MGKRNHRFFAMFLLWTSVHSLLTFTLTLAYFLNHFDFNAPVKDQGFRIVFSVFLLGYAGVFFLTLGCFWGF